MKTLVSVCNSTGVPQGRFYVLDGQPIPLAGDKVRYNDEKNIHRTATVMTRIFDFTRPDRTDLAPQDGLCVLYVDMISRTPEENEKLLEVYEQQQESFSDTRSTDYDPYD